MFRILIVCTGNVCRSPMGEGILKSLLRQQGLSDRTEVRSAGTWAPSGSAASPSGVKVAAQHGVRIDKHSSTPVSRSLLHDADLVLVMEPTHLEEVLAQVPEAEGKVHVLTTFADPEDGDPEGVVDPMGGDETAYGVTYDEIDHWLRLSMPRILSLIEESESADGRTGAAEAASDSATDAEG